MMNTTDEDLELQLKYGFNINSLTMNADTLVLRCNCCKVAFGTKSNILLNLKTKKHKKNLETYLEKINDIRFFIKRRFICKAHFLERGSHEEFIEYVKSFKLQYHDILNNF